MLIYLTFLFTFQIKGRTVQSRLKNSKRKKKLSNFTTLPTIVLLYILQPSLAPGRDLFFLPSEIILMFESGCTTHRWDCYVFLEGKEDVENYGPEQPNLRPEEDYGESLHGTVFRYKMEKVTGVSQYGLNRSKSYLTSLIAFCAKKQPLWTASVNYRILLVCWGFLLLSEQQYFLERY